MSTPSTSARTYAPADPEQVAAYVALTARHTAEHAAFRAELLANGAQQVTNEWVMSHVVTGLHEHAAVGEADLADPEAHAGHLYFTDNPHGVQGWCGKPAIHGTANGRGVIRWERVAREQTERADNLRAAMDVLVSRWKSEVAEGHGANRAGLAVALDQLSEALDEAAR